MASVEKAWTLGRIIVLLVSIVETVSNDLVNDLFFEVLCVKGRNRPGAEDQKSASEVSHGTSLHRFMG
jgi:hypothetical protein